MSLISNTVDRIYMYDNLHLALSLQNIMDFVHVSMLHLRFLECRKNSTATVNLPLSIKVLSIHFSHFLPRLSGRQWYLIFSS